jgi:hypothetical protein
MKPQSRNSKFESRQPCCPVSFGQFETNPKDQNGREFEAGPAGGASVLVIGVLDFEFVSDFGFFYREPPPENVASARDVARPQARRAAVRPGCASGLACRTGGGYVRSVYTPEPPLWIRSRAGHGSGGCIVLAEQGGAMGNSGPRTAQTTRRGLLLR